MNRTMRAILAVIFILIITFCAISIFQDIGRSLKVDITDQKLYTLSSGSKSILSKLNQPIKLKLYYAETAALKGPDQIRYFNNYYQFVKSLLEEYETSAKGMIELTVIDPRPFSDEEADAIRYGLQKYAVTEEENFFFGLVVQTQLGIEKTIPFFTPDRQNFVEYDISYLIDTAITRQKTKIGIMSSLPVTGDDVTGYMAQMMMMQGQKPKPAWVFVEQLRGKYEVESIAADCNEIKDIDILLVVHPKDLSEQTMFAIDQFILKGGRTIICVDPHCVAEKPDRKAMMMRQAPPSHSSNIEPLLKTWGLKMPENTFAGDRNLALRRALRRNQRPEPIIGFLEFVPGCFNSEDAITANLNQVRMLMAGVLEEITDGEDSEAKIERKPLLFTTDRGNAWKTDNYYELTMPNPSELMKKFSDGTEPVNMGYLVTGKFKSAFPDGIEIPVDPNDDAKGSNKITGLTEATEDCAVIVFSDVDFISDMLAYQKSFFGNVTVGDNSALLLNSIEAISGSSDLISIRSRGNFERPFVVVDQIEKEAEKETAEEEAKINAEINGFQTELQQILSSAKKGEESIIGSTILQKKKEVELKIHKAQRDLRDVKMKKRQRIEKLGNKLRFANMFPAPAVVLIMAVGLGIYRSVRKRHYRGTE